jgi:hypothetical protein
LTWHAPIAYNVTWGTDFGQVFRHDPYCLLDPSCLNPLGGGTDGIDGGFVGNFDDMNRVQGLAFPNYIFFLACNSVVAVATGRLVRHRWLRLSPVTILCVWICLAVNRWFAAITTYQDSNSGVAYLGWLFQHLAFDAVSLGTVWLVIHKSRPASS